MAKKKISKKQSVVFDDLTWTCGDCGNLYSLDVKYCPNKVLDALIVEGIVDVEDLDGSR